MTESRAASFYTRHAALYDRIASDAPFVAGLRRQIVDVFAPTRGDVVVEMGCGTGANLSLLRERVGPEGTVLGIDVSAGVVSRARDRVERAGWGNVHVARADALSPPVASADLPWTSIPAGEVDGVLATFLTGMIDDPERAVDDWCRIAAARPRRTGVRNSVDSGEGNDSRTAEAAEPRGGRICVAGFARSTTPIGRFVNPLFAGCVRLSTPPGRGRGRPESPVHLLDRRALTAHRRVHERCPDATTARLLSGFVRVTAGTVERTRGRSGSGRHVPY